ncbi:DUF397 domain-containing protein [Streptomyces sp. S.PNR 29]|uniref:DUF397 domain-containing protein n=1 Tax=Streptomyces sp. S.PNR 29 TaxID=2973805 RepID=UPI0025B09DD0|nr:DUF397 domain-containing protein [Streptomyces sp. S.PNR 29]MDN0193717.1 DUF397 domain-containing protein [Streptomyces sp. S.PNR 29]
MIRKSAAGDVSELTWFKSSYSDGPNGDSCVEVAIAPRTIHIRDSKHTQGPRLTLTPTAWSAFVSGVSK